LTASGRVPAKLKDNVEKWIRSGGILAVDYHSLLTNDNTHGKIEEPAFLGHKRGKLKIKEQSLASNHAGLQGLRAVKCAIDKSVGCNANKLKPLAKAVLIFADGTPAVIEYLYGKGKVYSICASLGARDTSKLFRWLAKRNKIEAAVKCTQSSGLPAANIQIRKLGKNKRFIWYAANYQNKAEKVRLSLNEAMPDDLWRVRLVKTGEIIKGKNKDDLWSNDELRNGVPISIPPFSARLLLLEAAPGKPIKLKQHPQELAEFLLRFENISKRNPVAPKARILFHRNSLPRNYFLPTAVWMLQNFGYEVNQQSNLAGADGKILVVVNEILKKENLKDYDVVIYIAGQKIHSESDLEEQTDLVKYVKDGGSLLVCGAPKLHRVHRGNRYIKPLLNAFGINMNNYHTYSKEPYEYQPYYLRYSPTGKHPVLRGVNEFYGSGEGTMKVESNCDYDILLKAPQGSKDYQTKKNSSGKPVMVAASVGKGRIIFVNGARWLRPDDLWRGNNARLLLNAIDWLAKVERGKVPQEKIGKIVDIRPILNTIDNEIDWK